MADKTSRWMFILDDNTIKSKMYMKHPNPRICTISQAQRIKVGIFYSHKSACYETTNRIEVHVFTSVHNKTCLNDSNLFLLKMVILSLMLKK